MVMCLIADVSSACLAILFVRCLLHPSLLHASAVADT